ncbi:MULTISPECIES: Imm26 family immunity protein [Vagococcus]|uniref:Imm26 family immunity protein n=1 Tax=Vagococcus TaxID=2737 RepID=UPI000E54361E|nr:MULTISPECIES: Imm26 family immunity protein [Vagococcus]RHH66522.1 hypothetical protein DW196_10795 [Vagococcus sp. AM17-17]
MKKRKNIGDVYAIELPNGKYAFGRVMRESGLAVYKEIGNSIDDLPSIEEYMFIISVFDYVFKESEWNFITNIPFENEEESWPPKRSVYDMISKSYSIYYKGEFFPSTKEECENLESATVWGTKSLIDRIMGDDKWN